MFIELADDLGAVSVLPYNDPVPKTNVITTSCFRIIDNVGLAAQVLRRESSFVKDSL